MLRMVAWHGRQEIKDNFFQGDYNTPFVADYNINGGSVTINFRDAADESCVITVVVQVPEECIEVACLLESTYTLGSCDALGTPDDMDDTYSFTFVATNGGRLVMDLPTSWIISHILVFMELK
ncbi:MAG: hypothetical protein R2795_19470 [Saprospiraceae bacterium]